MHNKGSHTKYNIQPLIRHIRYWVQTQFSLFRCKVLHGTPCSIIYITRSNKNPSIRSHDENMKYFFQMINDCNFLYETKCIDHYQKCKFASMICKTRCPADTNTNDVEKTCIKIQTKSMVTGSIINLMYIIHIKIFKPLTISQVMLMY